MKFAAVRFQRAVRRLSKHNDVVLQVVALGQTEFEPPALASAIL